jgi:hypothetical protein
MVVGILLLGLMLIFKDANRRLKPLTMIFIKTKWPPCILQHPSMMLTSLI